MAKTLKIAVVERDRERAMMIVDGLSEAGAFDVSVIGDESGFARKIAALDPDVVLIDLEHPSRDVLEGLAHASGPEERPAALFVDRTDDASTKAAIEAGISAYVVEGLRKDRIKPTLDAAHMLSPVPVALSLGLGGMAMDALSVLSVNGNAVGVSPLIAARLRDRSALDDSLDPGRVGAGLLGALDRRPRIGVPFPYSMHAELLYYWL